MGLFDNVNVQISQEVIGLWRDSNVLWDRTLNLFKDKHESQASERFVAYMMGLTPKFEPYGESAELGPGAVTVHMTDRMYAKFQRWCEAENSKG